MLHISLHGETLFMVGPFAITNTILTTWVVMGIIILTVFILSTTYKYIPGKLQVLVESIVGGLYGLYKSVVGDDVHHYYAYLATFFLFIISMNWFGLLPGVGTFGINKIEEGVETFVPFFRAPTADLNTTIALSIIAFIILQYFGMKKLGAFSYAGKFISFKSPIHFFQGLLEIVSEIGKIISFSFRLFGNIFAGEVLLAVIAFLIPLFAPLPFLLLEIFVGFIQALVFSMLVAVFISNATAAHQE